MSNAHRGTPKNIVLLSDGTGNSSAKLMKTNVWRMYEAIDLTKGDQLALYDNGVGTSSFKPLAVLGGRSGGASSATSALSTPSSARTIGPETGSSPSASAAAPSRYAC